MDSKLPEVAVNEQHPLIMKNDIALSICS